MLSCNGILHEIWLENSAVTTVSSYKIWNLISFQTIDVINTV